MQLIATRLVIDMVLCRMKQNYWLLNFGFRFTRSQKMLLINIRFHSSCENTKKCAGFVTHRNWKAHFGHSIILWILSDSTKLTNNYYTHIGNYYLIVSHFLVSYLYQELQQLSRSPGYSTTLSLVPNLTWKQ